MPDISLLSQHDPLARAATAAAFGAADRRWPMGLAAQLSALVEQDPDPRVRATACVALVRRAHATRALRALEHAARDEEPAVRRRAAQACAWGTTDTQRARRSTAIAVSLLSDPDALVVDAALAALGDLVASGMSADTASDGHAVEQIVAVAAHDDPLVRESAVAALGAIGDERGRATILAACHDKPAIRRRAVLALAAFDGDDVEAAIQAALTDRDWQVRQAAEDLV